MKRNLPFLTQERMNIIFDHVYDIAGSNSGKLNFSEEKHVELLTMLKTMQTFNYKYRQDDIKSIFNIANSVLRFEANSEGTSLWLSMLLAIKEVYGFSDGKIHDIVKLISVRK